MTNREAIYQVRGLLKESNADSHLTNKLVFSLLMKHAKWLISRDSDALKLIKKSNTFQDYKCVDVISAPSIDSCCGIRSYCNVWRTKDRLPELLEDGYGPIIKSVNTIDNSASFTVVTPAELERKLKNPWIKGIDKKLYYFYSDGYLYFPGIHYKKINIKGLFLGSVVSKCDAASSSSFLEDDCVSFMDSPFVVPDYLLAQLFDYTLKELGNMYLRLPEKSQEINKNDNLSNE